MFVSYAPPGPKLPVTPSKDLDRILSLPTRQDVHTLPGGVWKPELANMTPEQVSAMFRKPGGTMVLKPIQARALVEAARSRGMVGRIPVGRGKTLLSLLLPEVFKAQRALLLVPAALMGSLEREIKKYTPHFRLPLHRIAKVMSHADLSLPSSTRLLEELQPDAVIIDEVDAFANRNSVRTDRLLKYGRKYPKTLWGVESGTLFQKSVCDAVYWFALALRERSPLPLQRSEIETWADVLDPLQLGQEAREPGALMRLCEPGETPREGWNRRASAVVGVVTSQEERLGVALNIHERPLALPEVLRTTLKEMNKTWTRPDGKEFSMALDLARLERQISAGFYLRWVQEPTREWLEARNRWNAAVRRRFQGTRREGMDSPWLVEQAAEQGFRRANNLEFDKDAPHFESPEWTVWRQHKDTPEPDTEAITLSDYLWQDAAAWGREHVGIIWYMHDHVGQNIARLGNFPLYEAGNSNILDESGTRTVVASLKGHGVGKNLQMFNKALMTESPSSGQAWQQVLARLHREGQEAAQVDYYIYRHCGAYTRAWATARRKAHFMGPMNADEQRILYATKSFDEEVLDGNVGALGFTDDDFKAMDELGQEDDLTD